MTDIIGYLLQAIAQLWDTLGYYTIVSISGHNVTIRGMILGTILCTFLIGILFPWSRTDEGEEDDG